MTTTLTARDLSDANYPEIVAWVQDIAQACWTVAGKNHKPAFELQENRVCEVINALSLGHTRSVLTEVTSGPEWAQKCQASLKKKARDEKRLEEYKNTCKDKGKLFEKSAPASSSPEFLYAIGNGDVWLLLELMMNRYLGRNVASILEATFNRERKPGEMKSSEFYYKVQQMNLGKKFLPGGQEAILTPDFIVWTGVLFNHSTKTQEKLKEFNLMDDVPKTISLRASKLRQIETLDQMCYETFKATRSERKKGPNKRHRNDKRSNNNKNDKKPKVKCNYCQRLGHTEEECWKKNPALRPRQRTNSKPANEVNVMETYEFSNIGVDRHYEELQPSDTSINTQFDTMELEDAEQF